jgi:hypothetical protein
MSLGLSLFGALIAFGVMVASTEHAPVPQVGVVVTVDQDTGEITLVHRGGTRSFLTADPSLLKDVRIGTPVQVVTDGTVIRALRCL